ncbi:hypothetical protein EYY60_19370 [Flavobacterium zhairuonense]|uniref:hypothetical protein n=1 Tax=Flavobacterium zhairuonense TaxID=2493631 RepID=UPI0010511F27|nr:hypothetical protein [Flavobacterium zhairuonense]KAF2506679.1 hypothetical protein EYY60_19370 [Flavobacterium zhairuonense]
MKISDDIQKLLPFGYLFLVIMGIVKECIFHYQLGINILKYSTIMDILISPIATFTSNPIVLIFILSLFIFHYNLPSLLAKYSDKKFIIRTFELKKNEGLTPEETKSYFNSISVKTLAAILCSFFLGYGLAGGYATAKKIRDHKESYNYKINYNSGESEEIFLINTNSLYYFYTPKGSKAIKITPLGAVKNIELIDNKMVSKGLFLYNTSL